MKLLLAQIAPKLGRLEDNLARHRDILAEAWAAGAGLVVFPELSLTGYLLRDHVPQVALPRRALVELFDGLTPGAAAMDLVVGFVELSEAGRCHAAAAYLTLAPGAPPVLRQVHRKVHLPTYGMFDERRYFSPGRRFRAFDTPALGRCALLVCEDLWHPVSVWLTTIDGPDHEGAQALVGIANSPARGIADTERFAVANHDTWRRLNQLYAQLYGLLVIHVQRVGVEDSYVFTGGSEVVAPGGESLAAAPLFDEALLEVELDPPALLRWQRSAQPSDVPYQADLVQRELRRIIAEADR